MRSARSTAVIAAVLAMFLAGCGPEQVKTAVLTGNREAIRAQIARACPSPTTPERLNRIVDELRAANAAGVPPNTLATEWERLDEGARACRRTKP